jgi:hypothetical protein
MASQWHSSILPHARCYWPPARTGLIGLAVVRARVYCTQRAVFGAFTLIPSMRRCKPHVYRTGDVTPMATRMPRSPSAQPRQRGPAGASQSFLRRQLGVVLGAVAGVALSVAALLVLSAIRASPTVPAPDTTTARALCADLQSRHYAALYTLLTPDLQAAGTASQFVASQQELDIASGRVTTCAYHVQRVASDEADLVVTVQRGEGAPSTSDVILHYIGSAWRIGSYDSSRI